MTDILLDNSEIEFLMHLLGSIESQNWQVLENSMRNDPIVFRQFAMRVSRSSELNGVTILHACARFNPPPHIVHMYLDILPESAASIDCLGRYPLHVAAGTRSNIQVLDIIAQAYPNACDSQDEDGKTPLMLACDTSCELFEDDNEIRREPPSCEVIMTLMKASPYSLLLEDEDGMSALEHSIFSDAPYEVVKLLQHGTKELREIQHLEKGLTPSTSLEQKSMTACEDKIELREAVVIPATEEEFSQNTMMKDMCTSRSPAVVMC